MNGAESLYEQGEFIFKNSFMLKKGISLHIIPEGISDLLSSIKKLQTQSFSGIREESFDILDKVAEAKIEEEYDETDDFLIQAVDVVLEAGMASTSLLQRRLKLGYARAARLMDVMEEIGFIGPAQGSSPRQVLIPRQQWTAMKSPQFNTPIPPAIQNNPADVRYMDSRQILDVIDMNSIHWKFVLLRELINTGINNLADLKSQLFDDQLPNHSMSNISPLDSLDRISKIDSEMLQIIAPLKSAFEDELQDAMGLPGEPGNVEKIMVVCEKIVGVYRNLINWGLEAVSLPVEPEMKALLPELRVICSSPLSDMEKMRNEIVNQVNMVEAGTSTHFNVHASIRELDMSGINRGVKKLKQCPVNNF